MSDNPEKTRCGYVAIVGRPNVGKSTLLNHLLKAKLSITSRRPQTTRHQIHGILTKDDTQYVFVDTPGIHTGRRNALNRYMNRAAISALSGVDAIVFMIEAGKWLPEDERVLHYFKETKTPVILVVNKIDLLPNREAILPYLEECANRYDFAAIYPLSARKSHHIENFLEVLSPYIPEGPWMYGAEQITDRGKAFIITERIREKIMRNFGEELPYETTVSIEQMQTKRGILHVHAVIWVEREGQKPILIGGKGQRLKQVGEQARIDLESLFSQKVFLKIWVKVKSQWSDDESAISALGYDDD